MEDTPVLCRSCGRLGAAWDRRRWPGPRGRVAMGSVLRSLPAQTLLWIMLLTQQLQAEEWGQALVTVKECSKIFLEQEENESNGGDSDYALTEDWKKHFCGSVTCLMSLCSRVSTCRSVPSWEGHWACHLWPGLEICFLLSFFEKCHSELLRADLSPVSRCKTVVNTNFMLNQREERSLEARLTA